MLRYCFTFLLSFLAYTLAAQSGYKITARIQGLRDSTCYLAYYTGLGNGQFFVQDTAKADAQGNVIFTGSQKLPEGLYVISISQWKLFDLIVDADQDFELITDKESVAAGNPPKQMKVVGSMENELFYAFNHQMQSRIEPLQQLRQTAQSDPTAAAKMKAIQKELTEYRKKFIREHAGSFTAQLFKAAAEPEIPAAPLLPNGRPDSTFAYRYYKNHYFDGIDLSDERLLRTPFLQQKLENFFENLVYQSPDSLSKEADKIMSRAKGTEMRRYLAYWMTSRYEQSKVLGVDGFFVHMGEKYYVGEPALWDSSTVTNFKNRIAILKPLLVGKTIPNMYQTDTLGRPLNLHDLKANYTIVFIYSDDCGHCRDSMPKMKAFYQKYKNRGVKIYATDLRRDPKEWRKFIQEFKIQDFTNVIDIHKDPKTAQTVHYTDYLKTFDAQATPTIYVLDKDKKIIARKIPAEELDKYFEFMLNQQAKKKS